MKIYFDGDSWTRGNELEKEHRESLRFSGIVSKKLGAEETNLSKGGCSNNSIVRKLLIENDISQYDLAVIQMVYPERTEYFNLIIKEWKTISIGQTTLVGNNWDKDIRVKNMEKDGVPLTPSEKREIRDRELDKRGYNRDFWKKYYKEIYNDTYGFTYEQLFATTIRSHCKANNVPLILMSQYMHTKVKPDIFLQNRKRYPQTGKGHPNMEGHRNIAEDILRLI